jgi:hypothetical protein
MPIMFVSASHWWMTGVPALDSPDPAGVVRVSHSGDYPGVGTLVAGHRRGRIRVALIQAGVGVFGPLIGQYSIDRESASQPGQHRGPQTGPISASR